MKRTVLTLLGLAPSLAHAAPDVSWTWYEAAIEGDRVRVALDMPTKHPWAAEAVASRPAEDASPEALLRLERYETLGALRWSVRHGVSAWQSGPKDNDSALSVTKETCAAAWATDAPGQRVREVLDAGSAVPCVPPVWAGATIVAEKFVPSARSAGTVYRGDFRGPEGRQQLLVDATQGEVWVRALYDQGGDTRALRGLRYSEAQSDRVLVQLPGGLAVSEYLVLDLPSPVTERTGFRMLPRTLAKVEVRRQGAPPLTLTDVPLPERPSVRVEKLDSVTRMNQAGSFWVDVLDAGGGTKLVGRVASVAKLTVAAVREESADDVTVAVAKDALSPRDYVEVQYASSEFEGIAKVIAESLRLALPALPVIVSEGNPAKASVVIEVGG